MPRHSYIVTVTLSEKHPDLQVASRIREVLTGERIWKGLEANRSPVVIKKTTVRPRPTEK